MNRVTNLNGGKKTTKKLENTSVTHKYTRIAHLSERLPPGGKSSGMHRVIKFNGGKKIQPKKLRNASCYRFDGLMLVDHDMTVCCSAFFLYIQKTCDREKTAEKEISVTAALCHACFLQGQSCCFVGRTSCDCVLLQCVVAV